MTIWNSFQNHRNVIASSHIRSVSAQKVQSFVNYHEMVFERGYSMILNYPDCQSPAADALSEPKHQQCAIC
jgi:hypothetical protein